MKEIGEFQIIQDILNDAMRVADDPWHAIIINYYVEKGQCSYTNSYLVERNGVVKEESLVDIENLDDLMRQLRKMLQQTDNQPFTNCKIHLRASGKYDVHYGYDPVDWDALLVPDWNFFPAKTIGPFR